MAKPSIAEEVRQGIDNIRLQVKLKQGTEDWNGDRTADVMHHLKMAREAAAELER